MQDSTSSASTYSTARIIKATTNYNPSYRGVKAPPSNPYPSPHPPHFIPLGDCSKIPQSPTTYTTPTIHVSLKGDWPFLQHENQGQQATSRTSPHLQVHTDV